MYHFAIAENQFSGTIPSMRHNPFMGIFALRRNRFSGPVPSDFHSGCFWLDLNGNRFSGENTLDEEARTCVFQLRYSHLDVLVDWDCGADYVPLHARCVRKSAFAPH